MSINGAQKNVLSNGTQSGTQSSLMENIKERLIMQKASQEGKGAKHPGLRQKSPDYLRSQSSMNSLMGSESKGDIRGGAFGEAGKRGKDKFIPISSPKSGSKEKEKTEHCGRAKVESEEGRRCGNSEPCSSSQKKVKKTLNYTSIQAASISQLKQSLSRQQPSSSTNIRKGNQLNIPRGSHNRSDSRENNSKSRTSGNKKSQTSMSLHETGRGGKRKLLSNSAFVGLGSSNIQRASEQFQTLPTEADSNYLSSLNKVKYNNFFKNISTCYSSGKKVRPQSPSEKEMTGNKMNLNMKNLKAVDKSMEGVSSSGKDNFELAEIEKMIDNYITKVEPPGPEKNPNMAEYFQEIFPFLSNLSEKHALIGNIFQKVRLLFERPCRKMIDQINSLKQFYRLHKDSANEVESLNREKAELERDINILLVEMGGMKKKLDSVQAESKLNKDAKNTSGYLNLLEDKLRAVTEENEKLKLLAKKQRVKLAEFQIKEEKIMRLLYAIRITGVNIEAVYDEYVRTPKSPDHFQPERTNKQMNARPEKEGHKGSMVTEDSFVGDSSSTPQAWEEMLSSALQENKGDNGYESKETAEAMRVRQIKVKAQGRPDERNQKEIAGNQNDRRLELKKQLRLDLSALRGDSSSFAGGNQSLGAAGLLNNQQKALQINTDIPLKGFHEEFMAKISEFSESWRQAALLERKF